MTPRTLRNLCALAGFTIFAVGLCALDWRWGLASIGALLMVASVAGIAATRGDK